MKKILSPLFILLITLPSFAQFYSEGKITFERKLSLRRQLQTENESEWVTSNIDKFAQFTASEFTLTFNKEASEYDFIKDQEVSGWTYSWGISPGSQNMVYTDYLKGNIKAQKLAYEANYLVQDTLPKFNWKIEDEMRTIAGFPCRKAVTVFDDSVIVVAFYCDQIMVSGGPESFNGLPGMILGLAIPRLYTTWFATNVDILPQEVKPFKPLKKSKIVSQKGLLADVDGKTKDWGKYASKLLWWLTL